MAEQKDLDEAVEVSKDIIRDFVEERFGEDILNKVNELFEDIKVNIEESPEIDFMRIYCIF